MQSRHTSVGKLSFSVASAQDAKVFALSAGQASDNAIIADIRDEVHAAWLHEGFSCPSLKSLPLRLRSNLRLALRLLFKHQTTTSTM